MPKTYTRVFKDKKVKQEMYDMLLAGYSDPDIARHYGCDRSSINHHRRTLGIPKVKVKEGRKPLVRKPPPEYDGERINRGKLTYQEYLDEEKANKERLLWEK